MAKKVVAIVGSYRKGGATDSVVDAVLDGAKDKGVETRKIYLLDSQIEFCRNCRKCTQQPGEQRGQCSMKDEMGSILNEIESADSVVLAAPVNCWNVTAIFRRFLERLIVYCYWPWGKPAPAPRSKKLVHKAVLISCSAMPGFLQPVATGAPRALKNTAKMLGAKPIAKMWVGLVSSEAKPKLSERTLNRARAIGMQLG